MIFWPDYPSHAARWIVSFLKPWIFTAYISRFIPDSQNNIKATKLYTLFHQREKVIKTTSKNFIENVHLYFPKFVTLNWMFIFLDVFPYNTKSLPFEVLGAEIVEMIKIDSFNDWSKNWKIKEIFDFF